MEALPGSFWGTKIAAYIPLVGRSVSNHVKKNLHELLPGDSLDGKCPPELEKRILESIHQYETIDFFRREIFITTLIVLTIIGINHGVIGATFGVLSSTVMIITALLMAIGKLAENFNSSTSQA